MLESSPRFTACAAALAFLAFSHTARAQAIHSTLVANGFQSPTQVTSAPGDTGRLFVTQYAGRIRVIRHGTLLPAPFLDVSATGPVSVQLLSIAFHPQFSQNGRFFVSLID